MSSEKSCPECGKLKELYRGVCPKCWDDLRKEKHESH